MSARMITGRLVCHRYAQLRRGGRHGRTLDVVLADALAPLPPHLLWVIVEEANVDPRTGRAIFYRTRSGRRPGALADVAEDAVITVRAVVEPWGNEIGGWISRVQLVDLADGAA